METAGDFVGDLGLQRRGRHKFGEPGVVLSWSDGERETVPLGLPDACLRGQAGKAGGRRRVCLCPSGSWGQTDVVSAPSSVSVCAATHGHPLAVTCLSFWLGRRTDLSIHLSAGRPTGWTHRPAVFAVKASAACGRLSPLTPSQPVSALITAPPGQPPDHCLVTEHVSPEAGRPPVAAVAFRLRGGRCQGLALPDEECPEQPPTPRARPHHARRTPTRQPHRRGGWLSPRIGCGRV